MEENQENNSQQNSPTDDHSSSSYTMDDAMKVTDDILKLSDGNNYKIGAFVHGLILAEEYSQMMYKIPQQQIAQIRRDCRNYIRDLIELQKRVATEQVTEPVPTEEPVVAEEETQEVNASSSEVKKEE